MWVGSRLLSNHKKAINTNNMRQALVLLVRGYQRVSKYKPATCRYWPTCSEYAAQAIQKHGPIRGIGMAAWRILRCNWWSPGGFDPIN